MLIIIADPDEAHVHNLDDAQSFSGPVDNQVGRLNVAMHHFLFVSVLQTDGRLANHIAGHRDRNSRNSQCDAVQLIAVDIFHHHEVDLADSTSIERPDDVRTLQQRRRPDFPAKTVDESLVACQFPGHNFNRDDRA